MNFVWMKKAGGEPTPVDPSYIETAQKEGYSRCEAPSEGKFIDAGVETPESQEVDLEAINKMKKADLIKFANSKGVEINASATVAEIRQQIIESLGFIEE